MRWRNAYSALAIVLLATSCSSSKKGADDADASAPTGGGSAQVLYTGAIPEPAALPPAPNFTAAASGGDADPKAEEEQNKLADRRFEAIAALAGQVRAGGADGMAALQTLFVASGVPVLRPDGSLVEIDGSTGFGLAVHPIELRLLAWLAATPAGLSHDDARALFDTLPGAAASGLGDRIVTLATTADAVDPAEGSDLAGDTFVTVLNVLGRRPGTPVVLAMEPPEPVLTWAQIVLAARRLSSEASALAVSESPAEVSQRVTVKPGKSATPARRFAGGGEHVMAKPRTIGPCDTSTATPAQQTVVSHTGKVIGYVLDKVTEARIDWEVENRTPSLGPSKLFWAQLLSSYLSLAAKVAAIQPEFTMKDAPLDRTPNRAPGTVRDLTVRLTIPNESWDALRQCLSAVVGLYGWDIPNFKKGPQEGVELTLRSDAPTRLLVGGGTGTGLVNRATTGGDGRAAFQVTGAPQPEPVAAKARRVSIDVPVAVVAKFTPNDLWKDLNSIAWDTIDVLKTGGLAIIPKLLERTSWFTYFGTVPVLDYDVQASFSAQLLATRTDYYALNQLISGCGSGRIDQSASQEVQYQTDRITLDAHLVNLPSGQRTALLPAGQTLEEFFASANAIGDTSVLLDLAATAQVRRAVSKPASGEKPELLRQVATFCAGGDEGGQAPPTDCGTRSFRSGVALYTKGNGLQVGRGSHALDTDVTADDLYENCHSFSLHLPFDAFGVDTTFSEGWSGTGAPFPSPDRVFDETRGDSDVIVIEGSGALRQSETGLLTTGTFRWALTLCRIRDGKAAC